MFYDYRNENSKMMAWLRGKPAPLVHAVASMLNWDYADVALEHVATLDTIDLATAAMIFAKSCPSNAFPSQIGDRFTAAQIDEGFKIRALISSMWIGGRYQNGLVQYDPTKSNERGFFAEIADGETRFRKTGMLTWPLLEGLMGPFTGQPATNLEQELSTDELHELAALQNDLGTTFWAANPYHSDHKSHIDWRIKNGFGEKPKWLK